VLAFAGTVLWMERRRPLRRRVDPGPRRLARNASVGALTAVSIAVCERPVIEAVLRKTRRRRWGLVPRLPLPPWIGRALAIVLLDYSLYAWHILLHRVPLLWRMHLPHHVDLDLDASTAARFHFMEFLASIPWRAAQVMLIGADRRALSLWQKLTLAEVVFHHANLRLPLPLEHAISRLVMTPRLHGIHHSSVRGERDSNFSSGLTVWDVLHGTLRADVPQASIEIGIPGWQHPEQVTLGRTLALPFIARQERGAPQRPEGTAEETKEAAAAESPAPCSASPSTSSRSTFSG
jgi:sterol desaturase/sphingolipid hydroxylase (fatty acid hydroxylase superfamily)